jgi:hypothetical protein
LPANILIAGGTANAVAREGGGAGVFLNDNLKEK